MNRYFVFKEQGPEGTGHALAATLHGDRVDFHVYGWNDDGQTCLGASLTLNDVQRLAEWLLQASGSPNSEHSIP